MSQMMNLKQGSVDVALGHLSKMKNAASMSQNQAFRSNTPSDATDTEIVRESVLKGMQNAVDKVLAGMREGEEVDTLKQNLIAESMSALGLDAIPLGTDTMIKNRPEPLVPTKWDGIFGLDSGAGLRWG
jgi:methanogenic corrinoid protein MtbC1